MLDLKPNQEGPSPTLSHPSLFHKPSSLNFDIFVPLFQMKGPTYLDINENYGVTLRKEQQTLQLVPRHVNEVGHACNDPLPTVRVDIVCFGPKGAFTALKRVYLVKRNLYIYSVRNLLSYLMWDITNTPFPHVDTTSSLYPMRLLGQTDKHPTPTPGLGIDSDTICITTHSQLCSYCSLWTQRGPHGSKTRLLG